MNKVALVSVIMVVVVGVALLISGLSGIASTPSAASPTATSPSSLPSSFSPSALNVSATVSPVVVPKPQFLICSTYEVSPYNYGVTWTQHESSYCDIKHPLPQDDGQIIDVNSKMPLGSNDRIILLNGTILLGGRN